jgi:choline dehydrogenase-like flavoprotein
VARVTYESHAMDIATRLLAKLLDISRPRARSSTSSPMDVPPGSRHLMGTLRMGADPAASVCDGVGKFHDLDNLYCADGGVFVTSSGYNPTLTIQALALRTAGNLVFPAAQSGC